jgi:hypothetical protein
MGDILGDLGIWHGGQGRRWGGGTPVDEVDVDLCTIWVDGETVERRVVLIVIVFLNVREVSFDKVNCFPVRNIINIFFS